MKVLEDGALLTLLTVGGAAAVSTRGGAGSRASTGEVEVTPKNVAVGMATVGAVAIGLGVLASSTQRVVTGKVPTELLDVVPPSVALSFTWRNRIVYPTFLHESTGRYDAVNENEDGAGASVGLIQWSQAPGGLAELTNAIWRQRPDLMTRYFGSSAGRMVAQLALPGSESTDYAARLAPIDGARLWQEPWLSRWKKALIDPDIKDIQDGLVLNGSYMRTTLRIAKLFGGTPTERGLALIFDRAVQQGSGKASELARGVVASIPEASFDAKAKLLAERAAEAWPKGAEDVRKRTAKILGSSLVSDEGVAVAST